MSIYIITESFFGNTQRIGEELAKTLDGIHVVQAANAPITINPDRDAVIIGAPTHNAHLPTSSTRKKIPGTSYS